MAAALNISDYLADADLWDVHEPDYAALTLALSENPGPGIAALDRTAASTLVLNYAARSPVVLAVVLTGDLDHIHVLHTPFTYPGDPANTTGFDNTFVALLGNDLAGAVPVIIPATSFTLVADTSAHTLAHLVGPTGHAAAPPVFRTGPHVAGTADTTVLRARSVLVLPFYEGPRFLNEYPTGRIPLAAFHTRFLGPGLANADAGIQAQWAPVEAWYRLASTNMAVPARAPPGAGHPGRLEIVPLVAGLPVHQQLLNTYVSRIKTGIFHANGVGGPQLSNATFNAGVTQINNTITATNNARLDFERARINKTFTDKYGTALATRLHNLTDAVDDAGLPPIHILLAASPTKGREYGILTAAFQTRATASTVPLTYASAPLATTKLVEDVFRSYQPATTGIIFGQGLSPFAIVCEGHPEMDVVKKATKHAEIAESGTSLSLADAQAITTTDVRFPSDTHVAAEKLYGWSVVIDVFHGVNHPIAIAVRTFVLNVGPALHRLAQHTGSAAVGMDLVCRVLYEAQQDYMQYAIRLANNERPAIPAFSRIENLVVSYRAEGLSPLPDPWYLMVSAPTSSRRMPAESGSKRKGPETSRERAGAVPTFNTNVDRTLLKRFRDSGHTTISSLMQGHEVAIPKHRGSEVCLTWALKGECGPTCKQAANHVRYPQPVVNEIGQLLTTCGVANAQP